MINQVHILGPQFSNFVRNVQLVCEEKAIDYTLGFEVEGLKIEFKGDQHGRWHPYKKLPVLLHGDFALSETAAICRYLDHQFPGAALIPEGAKEAAEVDQWCQLISVYIDKAIMRDYLLEIVFPKGDAGQVRSDVMAQNKPEFVKALGVLEAQLGEKDYLVGDGYTLADIMVAPILYYVREVLSDGVVLGPKSKLGCYLSRLEARPASKRVLVPKG